MRHLSRVRAYTQYTGAVKDVILSCSYKYEWEGRLRLYTSLLSQATDRANKYESRSESKERFAIQRYLLIIGNKQNMQVLSHTFTYFST